MAHKSKMKSKNIENKIYNFQDINLKSKWTYYCYAVLEFEFMYSRSL